VNRELQTANPNREPRTANCKPEHNRRGSFRVETLGLQRIPALARDQAREAVPAVARFRVARRSEGEDRHVGANGGPALSVRAIWIAAGVVASTVRIPAGTRLSSSELGTLRS
jgi:hypothetical protein